MADSKTWIDVADSAVLIGLGAIVGGFTGVWLAKINNKHAAYTVNQERKKRIIEEVLEDVDKFSRTASLFWALRANAANKLENKKEPTSDEHESLKETEYKLFEDFNILNKCRAKLLLIGSIDAESRLGDFRDVVDKLYKISYIHNVQCSEKKLVELREEISSARRAFYLTLNKHFMDEKK